MLARKPAPIWQQLLDAIDTHVAAEDRSEFLDTVAERAAHADACDGSGDAYIARVIRSLATDSDQEGED